MFGKHFASMYEGSMYGAGPVFFAVMGYVIANTNNSRLEINPQKLADVLGCNKQEVVDVLKEMQEPDPASRNKDHEGRKLIKEGEFQYFVTGWAKYQAIRNDQDRKESNKLAQQRHRAKLKKGKPLVGERAAVRAMENGDLARAEEIAGRDVVKKAPQANPGYPVQEIKPLPLVEPLPAADDEDFSGLVSPDASAAEPGS